MHRTLLYRLLAVALISSCTLPALGQFTRNKAANRKIDEAINTHYFATDFDKAEGVLLGTIEACGEKCSPQTLARAWMYVGVVRASGKQDIAGAKEAFSTALALDAKVKLDTDLASAETKAAFAEVGGTGEGGSVTPPPGGGEDLGGEEIPGEDVAGIEAGSAVPGGMTCTPEVREVQTRRPVPVSCASAEKPASVEMRYKPFGEDTWQKTALVKREGGLWQAEIPCGATADAGALRWYVQARTETGDVVDNYGTADQPVVITLTEDSAAKPPTFPGQPAPARCSGMGTDEEICPPDFPGCDSGDQRCGDKDWGASCGNSTECKCGLLCVEGSCETAPSCEVDSDCPVGTCISGTCGVSADDAASGPGGPYKKMWIGAHFAYDVGTIGGDDVCYSLTQANGTFACFEGADPYPNPARSFADPPISEEPHPGTNVESGIAPGTLRALVSFDYALSRSLTLGGRAGYALAGNPSDFLPVHGEARATYHFFGLGASLGPYVGLSFGLAEVDLKVPATMFNCSPKAQLSAREMALGDQLNIPVDGRDQVYGTPDFAEFQTQIGDQIVRRSSAVGAPAGAAYDQCAFGEGIGDLRNNLTQVSVDVYQKTGNFFAGGHLGGFLRFGAEANLGIQLNVNIMAMLPKQSLVIEPSLGFVYGL